MLRNFEEMAIIEIKTESPVTDSLADRWEQTNPPLSGVPSYTAG